MTFIYDENNAGGSRITQAGEYEIYPSSYVYTMTQETDNPMITMTYKVREDVDQPGAGSELRYDNFVDTKKSDWRFNSLTKATNAFEDKHDFGNPQGWAEQMLGRPIRAKVEMEANRNGKEYAVIKSFKPTEHPKMTEKPDIKRQSGVSKPPANSGTLADPFKGDTGQAVDISDDDLPF